jgi:ubiquinone biosynthesis protein
MLNSFGHIGRLLTIARILARHNALFALEYFAVAPIVVSMARIVSKRDAKGRPGERLARALNEAGPSFIKLGQALSTRSDLLGEELAQDLSQLQDSLPAFPGTEARTIIETELGRSIDELFKAFEDNATAAASIAQVHFAVTTDDRNVAIKVLRPGIESAFRTDLSLFRWLAKMAERARPELRRLKPRQVVETIAESVELEMDLRFEAAAAAELRENFSGNDAFVVPDVDWSRTSGRVLTTERISGIPMDDRDAVIAAGLDPETVLQTASSASFEQIFRDGFFHADVHPGNIFVLESGAVAVVDFGIMGRLDLKTRRHLGELLLAFLTRDYRRAAEVHFEAGWVPRHKNVDTFTQACRSIAEPIMDKPQNEISIAQLLGQLFQITETFDMEAQPQLLLLQKTMLVAEGTARRLCPDANMWFMARPLMESWMIDNFGPEARIRDTVTDISDTIGRLPHLLDHLEESSKMVSGGHLKLHPDTIRALRGGEQGSKIPVSWLIIAVLSLGLLITLID